MIDPADPTFDPEATFLDFINWMDAAHGRAAPESFMLDWWSMQRFLCEPNQRANTEATNCKVILQAWRLASLIYWISDEQMFTAKLTEKGKALWTKRPDGTLPCGGASTEQTTIATPAL
jgi:hypothetical protein